MAKKPYSSPFLVKLGSAINLTLGSGAAVYDGDGFDCGCCVCGACNGGS